MKKTPLIYLNLIKTLVNSDFLFLDQKNKKYNRVETLKVFSSHKDLVVYLDPLETLKGLKQLMRALHFWKKRSKSKLNMHFFLNDENTMISSLLKKFLKIDILQADVMFDINSDITKTSKSKKISNYHVGFILNKQIYNDKNFLKKQLNKDNFVLFQINPQFEINQNTYKIYNDLNDYKKSLFFISFLRKLLLNLHLINKHAISKKI